MRRVRLTTPSLSQPFLSLFGVGALGSVRGNECVLGETASPWTAALAGLAETFFIPHAPGSWAAGNVGVKCAFVVPADPSFRSTRAESAALKSHFKTEPMCSERTFICGGNKTSEPGVIRSDVESQAERSAWQRSACRSLWNSATGEATCGLLSMPTRDQGESLSCRAARSFRL